MNKRVLVDFRISKNSEKTLIKLGYNVIKTIKQPALQEQVSGHPDMVLCKLSDHDFVVENTFRGFLEPFLEGYNLMSGFSKLKPEYPSDIAYNCALVGNNLFCNEKYTDRAILEYCKSKNIKILNVKQGYAKCSICIVSDNAIITADKNIFIVAKENNIDALLIENKGIILKGYSEGFFGGATGLLEKDLLCVNGNIELHQDCDAIKSFCLKYGVNVVSLTKEPIYDIGTIIRL